MRLHSCGGSTRGAKGHRQNERAGMRENRSRSWQEVRWKSHKSRGPQRLLGVHSVRCLVVVVSERDTQPCKGGEARQMQHTKEGMRLSDLSMTGESYMHSKSCTHLILRPEESWGLGDMCAST
ncbi:unnamed protein product [Ectocarpus sp. 4 AP-2014]